VQLTDRLAQPHLHAADVQRLGWALRRVLAEQFDVPQSALQIEHAECPEEV
jgi:hypothetical protein